MQGRTQALSHHPEANHSFKSPRPKERWQVSWATAGTQEQPCGQPPYLKGQPCPILQGSTYCVP